MRAEEPRIARDLGVCEPRSRGSRRILLCVVVVNSFLISRNFSLFQNIMEEKCDVFFTHVELFTVSEAAAASRLDMVHLFWLKVDLKRKKNLTLHSENDQS